MSYENTLLNTSWKTASYTCSGQNCVEQRQSPEDALPIQVRDTKFREYGEIRFQPEAWDSFVHGIGSFALDETVEVVS